MLLPRAGDEKGAHMVQDQGGVSPIELKKGVRVGVEVPEGGTYVAVIERIQGSLLDEGMALDEAFLVSCGAGVDTLGKRNLLIALQT